jgi:hypothetical protein
MLEDDLNRLWLGVPSIYEFIRGVPWFRYPDPAVWSKGRQWTACMYKGQAWLLYNTGRGYGMLVDIVKTWFSIVGPTSCLSGFIVLPGHFGHLRPSKLRRRVHVSLNIALMRIACLPAYSHDCRAIPDDSQ